MSSTAAHSDVLTPIRVIDSHKINNANEGIHLMVMDEPGPSGAPHHYRAELEPHGDYFDIEFQKGSIREAGLNGLTHEVLLAILIDRLRGMQRGPYSCRENAIALTRMEEAQLWLNARTHHRSSRRVRAV